MFPNIFVNTCDTQAQNLATYSSRSISHLLTKVNRILHNISTFYHSLTLQTSRNGKGDYLDILIILHRKSHDCICNRDWVGGDEESRTPVRKNLAKGFSERSWCFKSPSVHRPSTGYALWQLLSCDRVRSAPLFTFTSNRRPLHSRGTLCRNEQHSGC